MSLPAFHDARDMGGYTFQVTLLDEKRARFVIAGFARSLASIEVDVQTRGASGAPQYEVTFREHAGHDAETETYVGLRAFVAGMRARRLRAPLLVLSVFTEDARDADILDAMYPDQPPCAKHVLRHYLGDLAAALAGEV